MKAKTVSVTVKYKKRECHIKNHFIAKGAYRIEDDKFKSRELTKLFHTPAIIIYIYIYIKGRAFIFLVVGSVL